MQRGKQCQGDQREVGDEEKGEGKGGQEGNGAAVARKLGILRHAHVLVAVVVVAAAAAVDARRWRKTP